MVKTPQSFTGFSPQAPNFLQELHRRNSKEWFEEHRPRFDALILTPFRALVQDLAGEVLKLDPQVETAPMVGRAISRVFRDTRFSKDKSYFRPAMWLVFKRSVKDFRDIPCFYFELTNEVYRYGVGFYEASSATMNALRRAIDEDPKPFQKISRDLVRQPEFALRGEEYKRPKRPELLPELAVWYNKKNIYVAKECSLEGDVFSRELIERLTKAFQFLNPVYQVLLAAAQAGQGAAVKESNSSAARIVRSATTNEQPSLAVLKYRGVK